MMHRRKSIRMKKLNQYLKNSISSVIESLSYPSKDFNLTKSKNIQFGDLSTNVALLLSSDLKQNPMDIGLNIRDKLDELHLNHVSKITVSKPGFLNFKILDSFFQNQIYNILNEDINYGKGDLGIGKTANVEFVSANPTGPLTIGHGRNAILGDTVSNILEWQGFKVTREYYFNNAGRQMRILGDSVEARYFEILGKDFQLPKDGYQGDYIKDIASDILKSMGENIDEKDTVFIEYAEKVMFENIKKSLKSLNINFDKFTNEKTFYENGDIDKLIKRLTKKDLIYKKDGATWFKTTSLGKDQDRVYIKSTGEPTYRVPDTAYHLDKIKRKFDLIIDVFGADHADSYPDVLIALEALGLNIDYIKILLYQFVTLVKNGEKVKMSTRKANFVTLDDLINELGTDVVRYFFVMRSMNTHLDFNLDLASEQSEKNPVYYIQYAHARISNIIRRYDESYTQENYSFNSSLITFDEEIDMLKHLVNFSEVVEHAYRNLEPQFIANYLQELASIFHKFYNKCRVITDNSELTTARINLIKSVKIILKNGLKILGITAPERM